MDERKFLTERFDAQKARLHAVAFRMLGSDAEADDAVQEAWLRLDRSDTKEVENLSGWLTTVVARVCLDILRSRKLHAEAPIEEELEGGDDPERDLMLAEAMGPALMVVLDTLAPAERLAFVLHDLFAVPFEEIAPILGRTAVATRKLASRARERVQGVEPSADQGRAREIVSAFLAAARGGDFKGLLSLLHPDAAVFADDVAMKIGAPRELRGSTAIANQFNGRAAAAKLSLIDGRAGAVWVHNGKPRVVIAFTIENDKITAIRTMGSALERFKLEYLE